MTRNIVSTTINFHKFHGEQNTYYVSQEFDIPAKAILADRPKYCLWPLMPLRLQATSGILEFSFQLHMSLMIRMTVDNIHTSSKTFNGSGCPTRMVLNVPFL